MVLAKPMTALRLLQRQQEAPMSRVETKERPAKRETQESRRHTGVRTGRINAETEKQPVVMEPWNQDRNH